ncbi:MAG: protein kinase [Gemmataceae bacterium]|nr:protein kinase [Gemmataceae bacterium]
MPLVRTASDEPIPGYRLLEPLGKGGFGEVWKCSAPGGLCKAIKFVAGNRELDNAGSNAEQELRALELIKTIRHPFLLSIERVEAVDGDLVIVMELADKSLHDQLMDYREKGKPGIPRLEALEYLHEAAEVLDLLNQEHGLQHLDIKPRNLFLVGRHVKVADFGLVGSLADLFPMGGTGRVFAGGLTPLYAAPETFLGQVTLFSDQYSLAVTYHELVTGEPLFKAKNYNQLAMLATGQAPDLSRLPEHDRAVMARALAKKPRDRFPSCVQFLNALEDATPPAIMVAGRPDTDHDLSMTQMATTPGARASGLYRRRSRILPAIKIPAASPGGDPLEGYKLLDSLGRGPTGELWRAKGPGGANVLVRFVPHEATDPALERLKSITHPGLAGVRLLPAGPGRAAIVSEMGRASLADWFRERQGKGQAGLPREELLGHLGRAADTLDELYHQQQLQHLSLSPRHLALTDADPFLLDFGLAELLWVPQGLQPAQLNPRYSAPELFDNLVSDACDQYSLALLYQELLVGIHPFRNLNSRQLSSAKLRGQPDLSMLPGADRGAVAKALSNDPEQRFRSCREFVMALEGVEEPQPRVVAAAPVAPAETWTSDAPWKQALADLVAAASRGHEVRADAALPYRMKQGDHIESRAFARLAPGMARLKLTTFRDQWRAEKVAVGENRAVFQIESKAGFWDRCLGRSPAVQVEVCLGTPDEQGLTPVRIRLEPVECPKGRAEAMLAEMGPRVLSSLATHLGLLGHRNGQERFPLDQPVEVRTAGGRTVPARLRDIGADGACVKLPEPIPAGPVTMTLQKWASPLTFQAPGRVTGVLPVEKGAEAEVRLG